MLMNGWTRIFLVLLQLAIGWHFLFEGVAKFKKDDWTSKGYLSAAKGPIAPLFRRIAGAPELPPSPTLQEQDAVLLAAYQLKPINPNEDLSKLRWHDYLPEPLEKDWDAYYEAFLKAYDLKKTAPQAEAAPRPAAGAAEVAWFGPTIPWHVLLVPDDVAPNKIAPAEPITPDVQAALAWRNYVESKNELARWLYDGKKKVKRPKVGGPAGEFELTTPERVKEYTTTRDRYLAKLGEAGFFGKDSPELKRLKTATESLRGELAADLDAKKTGMKDKLWEVLTYEQRRMPLPAEEKPAVAPAWNESMLQTTDKLVKWGLLFAGCGLVLGLLTRTACVVGILLLISFYVTWPPFPGVPVPPNAEGNYFIINKNLIEMLALCVIASSYPAQRYGFDGLLQYMFRRDEPTPAAPPPSSPAAETNGVRREHHTVRDEVRTAETVSFPAQRHEETKPEDSTPAGEPSPPERSDDTHGT